MFARRMSSSAQDSKYDEKEDAAGVTATVAEVSDGSDGAPAGDEDGKFGSTSAAHRKLESYHVNLIAIGGSIGTASFIYVGSGLVNAGPANMLIAYAWWCTVIYCVAMCQMEMVTFWPTDTAFSRNASRYVDEAAGFALGWIFWAQETCLVAYEVTSFTVVLGYWQDTMGVNVAVYISLLLVCYFVLNIWNTRFFGNAEFGFAMGKILLLTGLLSMTFIAMLGGNPIHDRFGFRFWRDPGAMTGPYPQHGHSTNLFEGFLAAVCNAAFTVAGPEYLTMTAGEAKNPRKVLPSAFRKTGARLFIFFFGGALAIGILVPYNSTELLGAISTGAAGAAKSPYVIAMNRLKIKVLPHIVNALILSSIFSAGNAMYFAASRSLAQMARDGHAPHVFSRRNRHGVPWLAVLVAAVFSLLSYCQVSAGSQVAIDWLAGIVTACQLILWVCFSGTWIQWRKAMAAQDVPRSTLPATSWAMPWGAYYAFFSSVFVLFMQGYTVFLKGEWSSTNFIYSYIAPAAFVVLFLGWKLIKRTKWKRAHEVDLVTFIDDPAFDVQEYPDQERTGASKVVHNTLTTLF